MYDIDSQSTREILEVMFQQIMRDNTITIHQVLFMLRVALNDINSKSDLSDTPRPQSYKSCI